MTSTMRGRAQNRMTLSLRGVPGSFVYLQPNCPLFYSDFWLLWKHHADEKLIYLIVRVPARRKLEKSIHTPAEIL